ncbi:periplasmic heavy metal sensor [Croceicoccus estronivorus]|uniref:periplasmic heavy metal sensor n=1 Tax=Croceicoccus estronivorus TaxID=1172626 RepID=UPI001F354F5D|nr:periplasmic heavy metal sensor [Croceicoccus estronivorus]
MPQIALTILLALAAGFLGATAANHWNTASTETGLHAFVHDDLNLDSRQQERIDALEAGFATEREQLEEGLRLANAKLSQAMAEEHIYGPKVSAAIDEIHVRMGELQKATIRHVFAMRALLNAEQQRLFDRQVARSLTSKPDE